MGKTFGGKMLTAVNFHRQGQFGAIKIKHIPFNDVLTTKLHPQQVVSAQMPPEEFFGHRGFPSELAGKSQGLGSVFGHKSIVGEKTKVLPIFSPSPGTPCHPPPKGGREK